MGWLDRRRRPAQAAPQIQLRAAGKTSLWGVGRVRAAARRRDRTVPQHPGGGPHRGRRHFEAHPPGGRCGGGGGRPGGPGGPAALSQPGPNRTGTAGTGVLSGLLSGLPPHLRPGGGRGGAGPEAPGGGRPAVRQCGRHRDPGGGESHGLCPVCPAGRGRAGGAAPAGSAPLHPLSAGGRTVPTGCLCCAPCPSSRAFCSRSTRPSA